MENIVLKAETRRPGRHANREQREAANVPAVVYGPGVEPQPVTINGKELHRALVAAGAGLISLQIGDGSPVSVLAREVQRNPVKRNLLHVDFLAVAMNVTLRLQVPILMQGTAPVLSSPDFVLVRALDEIEIECLPSDIPNHLVADVTALTTIDDEIRARDLALPEGVRLVDDPDTVIISVTHTRVAAEAEEAAEAAPSEVEVVGKGKKEAEEEE